MQDLKFANSLFTLGKLHNSTEAASSTFMEGKVNVRL